MEQIDWIYSLGEPLANPSALQGLEKGLMTPEETLLSPMLQFLTNLDPNGEFGKTCQVSLVLGGGEILLPSSQRWANSAMGGATGCLMLNTSVWPKDVKECFLSDVLQDGNIQQKYYLSPKACQGILRRAEKRGKKLPNQLYQALLTVSKQLVTTIPEQMDLI